MNIKAEGIRNGVRQMVEYSDGVFLFNGEQSADLEQAFRTELMERHLFAGTYYPQSDEDPFNIIGVLQEHWYDKPVIVESDPEIALPSDPGVIY